LSWDDPDKIKDWLLANREVDVNGCWLWTRNLTRRGYGMQNVSGRDRRVHRISACLWLGFSIDSSLDILHECDVPRCFNWEHLSIGTASRNLKDAYARGRRQPLQGTCQPAAKLSDQAVVEMLDLRRQGWDHKGLARLFCVSKATIGKVLTGRAWKHVPRLPPA